MLRLNRDQRRLLREKLGDLANLSVAGLVDDKRHQARTREPRMTPAETNYVLMFGGIALIAWIVILLDEIASRRDRKSGKHQPRG